jgi:hypothetical protein
MLQAVIEKELQYTLPPPNIVLENVGCMALTINSYAKIATALLEIPSYSISYLPKGHAYV